MKYSPRIDIVFDLIIRLRALDPNQEEVSSQELAELMGISTATYWRLIKGNPDRIALETISRCCNVLSLRPHDLMIYRYPGNSKSVNIVSPIINKAPINGPIKINLAPWHKYLELSDVKVDIVELAQKELSQPVAAKTKALLNGNATQIDLPVISRMIYYLSEECSINTGLMDWMHKNNYPLYSVGMFLQ